MPMYEIEWTETRRMIGWVEADSESAAGQSWIDDALDFQAQVGSPESHRISIEEARHDRLCACPSCQHEAIDLERELLAYRGPED